MAIVGYTMRFGMMYSSRSMALIASSEANSTRYAGRSHDAPNRSAPATNSAAVANSTSG